MAGGAEKLLKLTLGLYGLEVDGNWPKAAVMLAFGHKITELNAKVERLIRSRISQIAELRSLPPPGDRDPRADGQSGGA
jgi:hypothetical protein